MTFSEKLKQAMRELGLNQTQVVRLTGKCKGSVSQYLSSKQVPSEEVQRDIAASLGLEADYFTDEDQKLLRALKDNPRQNAIQRLEVKTAAMLMGLSYKAVSIGLQQKVFPWGYAIHTSENKWTYFINAKRFAEIEGISLEGLA